MLPSELLELLLQSSKRNSWNQFIDEINPNTDPLTMWRKIQILNQTEPPPPTITLKTNDGYTHNPNIASALMAKAFATVSSNQSFSKEFLELKTMEVTTPLCYDCDNLEDYNQPITRAELFIAPSHYIKNIFSFTFCGRIKYYAFQQPSIIIQFLEQ